MHRAMIGRVSYLVLNLGELLYPLITWELGIIITISMKNFI